MPNKVYICGVNTNDLPTLTQSEMEELMAQIKQGNTQAKQQFIYANLKLVLSVLQKFLHKHQNADDLFQVGCVGLIKAIDNFNTSLNVKFSTYAVPMIIGEIRRFLRDDSPMRVSRSLRDIAYQALKAREKIESTTQKEASFEEIANELNLPLYEVACALDAISEPMSLEEPVYFDDNDTSFLSDYIQDEQCTQESWLNNVSIKDAIKELDEREKRILLMRYYLGKTQIEVSEEIGISQAQVSRLEKNALKVVKKFLI